MALTKVTKSGLADNSVDAAKLVDGTIVAADINDGTIVNDKLAGSIANAKLANSTITLNGSSLALGASATVLNFEWQSVKTSSFTAVSGQGYFVNTTSSDITVTLPASPSAGDYIAIKDYAATFQTNNVTIARNGSNIQGIANNSTLDTTRASVVLVYADSTKGWLYTNESNVADLQETPDYVTATGGTITTISDDKIHTFTSSGNFVVTNAGGIIGTLGSTTVEYYVLAAGGGSAGDRAGGGGGGGLRTNHTNGTPSPRDGGLAVTAQTYPITIGSGGSAHPNNKGTSGSNSVFSTITSAGGGGSNGASASSAALSGGTGGGGGGIGGSGATGGSGNTPPVSPAQGYDGGNGNGTESGPRQRTGGGGGGNAQAGVNGSTSSAGRGGNGYNSLIAGPSSPLFKGAGGGGGAQSGSGADGGCGGGGNGGGPGSAGNPGPANTGGGAGGGGCSAAGNSGGSGYCVIRYKYQN